MGVFAGKEATRGVFKGNLEKQQRDKVKRIDMDVRKVGLSLAILKSNPLPCGFILEKVDIVGYLERQ